MRRVSFAGKIGRFGYCVLSVLVVFSQHMATAAAFSLTGNGAALTLKSWQFALIPLRSLSELPALPDAMALLAIVLMLCIAWALALLAFRRANDANISAWIAALAVVPVVQIPVIAFLSVMPSRPASPHRFGDEFNAAAWDWPTAMQGMLIGVALTVGAVALGALIFGNYGYGMFVFTPLIIGTVAAYWGNRKLDIGAPRTTTLAVAANLLGAIALIFAALEGLVCIVLASPLGLGAAVIGALLGRAIANSTKATARGTLSAFAFLPFVFATESALPESATFEARETIDVAAPPDVVWRSLLTIDLRDEPVSLPFRLGVAYPIRGDVVGEGVGAVRVGVFSTGIAFERVTAWQPGRRLAFEVLNEIPAMRELSPYEHVNAPHVVGYFRTHETTFELQWLAGGHTRILETTTHELRLDPIFYWLALARWVVHENNSRVLMHIKRQAEHAAVAQRS